MPDSPEISIVIPVYNEEGIIRPAISLLVDSMNEIGSTYEIVLAENGSTDRTLELARQLERKFPQLRIVSIPEPNYGRALRVGILSAQGEWVLCDEIDLCDVEFYERSLRLLRSDKAELVIGSKLVGGAADDRPMVRHAASLVYTRLLRALLDFKGTDTHGVKGFRRTALLDVVNACLVDRDVFASELVIRAQQAHLRVVEIPVRIKEMRPPSINLIRRIPGVLSNLARLTWAIRFGKRYDVRSR